MMTNQKRAVTQAELAAYLAIFPEDARALQCLCDQLAAGEDVGDRRNFNGHLCGSGIVLSRDRQKVLLIHHKRFGRWQQPGGHMEPGDESPLTAARREVLEETGLRMGRPYLIQGKSMPLHIGAHPIPANPAKDEPAHRHYDFRYLFVADDEALRHQEEEVHAAGWFPLDAPETASIAEMLARLRTLPDFQAGS